MEPFADDVKSFISDHINSVEQLETLLLLFRDPERIWSASDVSTGLYTSVQSAAVRLHDLHRHGLIEAVEVGTRYRFNSNESKWGDIVAKVDKAYHSHRVSIIHHIYTQRTSPVQNFANAFMLRKKSKEST